MFSKKFKMNVGMMVVIIALVMIGSNSQAASHMKFDSEMDMGTYNEYIESDKAYLENLGSSGNIDSEIRTLEAELRKVTRDSKKLDNGIVIHTASSSLKNNAIRTSITNRKNFKTSTSNFNYNDKLYYTIGRDFTEEKMVEGFFTDEELELSLDSIETVLSNIELDLGFLKKTEFVVLPYKVHGINGYAISRSDGTSTIVIPSNSAIAPSSWISKQIQSTVLHEIGHVFYNNNENRFSRISSDHLIETDNKILELKGKTSGKSATMTDQNDEWKLSKTENFAEDFKVHFSSRLDSESFEPLAKKTDIGYDEISFTEFIAELTE